MISHIFCRDAQFRRLRFTRDAHIERLYNHCRYMKSLGFSLVEVCLVLSMILIMGSLLIPSYHAVHLHYQRDVEVSVLYQTLSVARGAAIGRQVFVAICPMESDHQCSTKNNWNRGYLVFEDPSHLRIFRSSDRVLKKIALSSDFALSWQGFPQSNILEFSSSGMTDTQNGTFLFCPHNRDAREAKAVFISQSGRLRLSSDQDHDGIDEDAEGKPLHCG